MKVSSGGIWGQFSKSYPKPVDKSLLNVLTSRGIFFCSRWKLLFEIPNIVRDIQKLDGKVMYLYNGGTTEYQCSIISRFHPTRYRHTGSAELLHYAFGSVGGSCRKQNPTLIFSADYIEHHFEARAMLPPISDALCNRLFLFFLHPTTEWPSEWDMTLRWHERSNAGVRLPGRNDIRVERRKRF